MIGDGFSLPPAPAPSSPLRSVLDDGTRVYGELDEAYREHSEGRDPETGERDGRYDGRVTAAVSLRHGRGPSGEAAPDGHRSREGRSALLIPVPGERELLVAHDLDDLRRLGL